MNYRKLFEPMYGEPSHEVTISEPQSMDMNNPAEWRVMNNFLTITELTSLWSKCVCFKPMMQIRTTSHTTLSYDNHKVPLRVYYPNKKELSPILVFYHGGGWCMNNLDVYDAIPRYIASYGGIIVVTPDYRLAPECKFPKGLEDSYAAFIWAYEHSNEIMGIQNKICIGGDSAGGNFTAAISLMARDRNGPLIKGQILIYPLISFNIDERTDSEIHYGNGDYFLPYNSQDKNYGYYLPNVEDAKSSYASPLDVSDLSKLPPACFISAECDPLLDQSLMYAAKLEDAGVPVEFNLVTGMIHAFINRPYQKTFESLQKICSFVNR